MTTDDRRDDKPKGPQCFRMTGSEDYMVVTTDLHQRLVAFLRGTVEAIDGPVHGDARFPWLDEAKGLLKELEGEGR